MSNTKDIKDYLHLYLGCTGVAKILYGRTPISVKAVLSGGYNDGQFALRCSDKVGNEWGHTVMVSADEFKPILRPLSDMTEEEAVDLAKIGKISGLDKKEIEGRQVIGYYSQPQMYDPEEMKYLLSKGFDLFGLIEADLAIDKTKIVSGGELK